MGNKIFNSNKIICSPKRIKKKCRFCFGLTYLVSKNRAKFEGENESNVKTLSYEFCKKCHKRKLIYLNSDLKLVKSYLAKNLNNFKNRLINKKEFNFLKFEKLVNSYSCFSATYHGSGLSNDFLKKYYISTYLSILPSSSDSKEILCGAVDKNEQLSMLKARMEFVERYALTNLSFSSPIFINEDEETKKIKDDVVDLVDLISQYLSKFKKALTCKKYLIMGVDFIKEKSVLVPLQVICNSKYFLNNYGFNAEGDYKLTSSNGFAAHINLEKAIENSVLELIERDAFIRWWMNPENCSVINVDKKIEKEIELVTFSVKNILDQDVYVKFLLLPSPVDVPVVFVFLSPDKEGFPAMLIGSAASFCVNNAIEKAFLELKIAVLNLIARFQRDPNWLNKEVNLKNFEAIKDVQDHAYFYHYPQVLEKLGFLKIISKKQPLGLGLNKGPRSIDELKIKMLECGINWYVIDFTPKKFEKAGVFVVKSFIPQFYMLFFGGFWPFKCLKKSKYSVAKKLPHCFP